MIVRAIFATAAIATFASTAGLAAPPKVPAGPYGVVMGKHKTEIVATHVGTAAYSRPVRVPGTAPTTIFSNLAYLYTNGLYWAGGGKVISGPKSDWGAEFWEASAFTPATRATATEIELALTYYDGTNAVVVTLSADRGGVPGRALATGTVKALPPFGTCCQTTLVSFGRGVKLAANTQYWITVQTNTHQTDATVVWNLNDADQVSGQTYALDLSEQGWLAEEPPRVPGVAFAVYGK
jgi:hypothetical protein